MTCNDTLTLVVNTQDGFENFCDNGFSTILETATTNTMDSESMITTVFDLVSSSPAVIDILSAESPMTVFLPINAAFEALDPTVLETVMSDEAERDRILSYHVVSTGLPAATIAQSLIDGQTSIDTVGGTVSLESDADGNIFIGGAQVISTDLFASNGVIHFIDGVILPVE